MKSFVSLNKLQPHDQVAIISPSAGLPGKFPWVQDLGLERMQSEFNLKPVEYPTTRLLGSSLKDRARDIMDAFADPKNKAVFASIGGSDQIRLMRYLDSDVFINNPKPFFGFSDNTHLHNYLWGLGIPSYYGGGIMNQFGMNQHMFSETVDSLRAALFESGECEIIASKEYTDQGLDWADPKTLSEPRPMQLNTGHLWDGAVDTEGILWGGCVESLIVQSTTQKYLPSNENLRGSILYLETSEQIPDHWIIQYLLNGFGERGLFEHFQAILVGRPKAWEFNKQLKPEEKEIFTKQQQRTVIETVRFYNQTIPIVQNIDFGHTDPQIIVPNGQKARILSSTQQIFFHY